MRIALSEIDINNINGSSRIVSVIVYGFRISLTGIVDCDSEAFARTEVRNEDLRRCRIAHIVTQYRNER